MDITSDFFDTGWDAGYAQYVLDRDGNGGGLSMQDAWEESSRDVLPDLRKNVEQIWKHGYACGYEFSSPNRDGSNNSSEASPPYSVPPSLSVQSSSLSTVDIGTGIDSAQSSLETSTSDASTLASESSGSATHLHSNQPVKKWDLWMESRYDEDDHIIIDWSDRFEACERHEKTPVVLYAAGVIDDGGKQYEAKWGVDARILCPVPGCPHTFEQLRFVERHIDGLKVCRDPEHTALAQSDLYQEKRVSRPFNPFPLCRICGWQSSTGGRDTLRRHETFAHGLAVGESQAA